MKYRREIDGLRAIAVLPVILFHSGLQPFSGGFVGVDVFFVISGYLITSIILTEKINNSFTLVGFYERRARRILPALSLVMATCLPFCWLWLFPADLRHFSASLIAVSTFCSNILFWRTSGYFDLNSELSPLLHTWSLAVEEQYYVFFPLFMMAAWRLGRRWIVTIMLTTTILSLAWAHWGTVAIPSATFFLLPTRAWELLIGALAAFYLEHRNGPQSNETGALVGLLLLLYSVFAFDHTTPFPSLHALYPTVGAALIILFASHSTQVGKLLGSKALVGIGLISYSAYLWHQPLFAFAKYTSAGEPNKLLMASLTAATFVLAFVTWKYVEAPFRNRTTFTRHTIFKYSLFTCTGFIVLGTIGIQMNGFENRLSPVQKKVYDFSKYDSSKLYKRHECFLDPENTFADFSASCRSTGAIKKTIMIWGDSYAAALSSGLRAKNGNLIQYTASACPPLLNYKTPGRPNCAGVNDFIKKETALLRPSVIYLHAAWHLQPTEIVSEYLDGTIKYIRQVSPQTQIIIVGNVPQWMPSLPIYALRKHVGLDKVAYLPMTSWGQLEKIDATLRQVATRNEIAFLSVLNRLCMKGACLASTAVSGGYALTAWDNGHLTEGGAVALVERFASPVEGDAPQPLAH